MFLNIDTENLRIETVEDNGITILHASNLWDKVSGRERGLYYLGLKKPPHYSEESFIADMKAAGEWARRYSDERRAARAAKPKGPSLPKSELVFYCID